MTALFLSLVLAITPAEADAAAADRAQFPQAEWGYCYYVSTSHLAGESRTKCEASLAFVVASSSRQEIVEKCTPVQIAEGMFRLRLDDLGWDWRQWHAVLKRYPYSRIPGAIPLVIRGDWLVVELTDTTLSDAYYRLLYGRVDLKRDDFLKLHRVGQQQRDHFGIITRSAAGPAVSGIRLIENRPTATRGSAWGTRDSARITPASDPLENLAGAFKHQAEEWLVAMPKVSLATGRRGSLLAGFLNDAQGKRQEEAPASIVTDRLGFRNQNAIRNWGSCIGCHAVGINDPGVSELRSYIAAGVDVYAKPKKLAEQVELFHLSDAGQQIKRDNEDFAAAIAMVNGLAGEANAEAYKASVEQYDREVTLATAADELYTTPAELRLAIAYYNQAGGKVTARLAGLAHEQTLPRAAWEDQWYTAYLAVSAWRKK